MANSMANSSVSFDIIIIGSGPGAAGFLQCLLNNNANESKQILVIEAGTNSVYDQNNQDLQNIHRVSCDNTLKDQHLRAHCVGDGATINASIYIAPSVTERDQ